MRYSTALAVAVLMIGLTLAFDASAKSEGIVAKPSAFSVKVTIDRLAAVFKKKGIRVFARINHAAAAKSIDKKLRPSELLIFGTPKIGTPLMQESIISGIDLPLKALAYQDAKGQVYLVYNHPGYLARRHEIKSKKKLISSISRILSNLTDLAIKDNY
jgi:uncharacterized protein (DUF302 family)